MMYRLAASLASGRPSLAVFAGGGRVTFEEMRFNVQQGREMIMIAGSKGTTDDVLEATLGISASDERLREITDLGRITPFSIKRPVAELIPLIHEKLFGI
jgi:hypothetical protein